MVEHLVPPAFVNSKFQIAGFLWALCRIPLGFSGQMRGNVPANPRGFGGKCGGFLPVLRLPMLQAVVLQGVVVGTIISVGCFCDAKAKVWHHKVKV